MNCVSPISHSGLTIPEEASLAMLTRNRLLVKHEVEWCRLNDVCQVFDVVDDTLDITPLRITPTPRCGIVAVHRNFDNNGPPCERLTARAVGSIALDAVRVPTRRFAGLTNCGRDRCGFDPADTSKMTSRRSGPRLQAMDYGTYWTGIELSFSSKLQIGLCQQPH